MKKKEIDWIAILVTSIYAGAIGYVIWVTGKILAALLKQIISLLSKCA